MVKTLLFDTWGTLFDNYSIADVIEQYVFESHIARAGCPKKDILWVTGHQWEAFGAVRQGLRVAWTNRQQQPKLQIGIEPTYTTKHLQHLADILRAENAAGKAAE